MVAGKMPYRDLFEHKGPITYFVAWFCCLFSNPYRVVWIIEVLCCSWFLLVCYRIARHWLNQFAGLCVALLVAVAMFSGWCRACVGDTVEEYCLPIFAYGLLCLVDFLFDQKQFGCKRSLYLGIMMGLLFWLKFTMLFAMAAPLLIWLIISMVRKDTRTAWRNMAFMLLGVCVVTLPTLIICVCLNILPDLWQVYFYVNIFCYNNQISWFNLLYSVGLFWVSGIIMVMLIVGGVVWLVMHGWRSGTGRLLITALAVHFGLVMFSNMSLLGAHYYLQLLPWAVFGAVAIVQWLGKKITINRALPVLYLNMVVMGVILCVPFATIIQEIGRERNTYVPYQVAQTIHEYDQQNGTQATLFTYKLPEYGFYNALGQAPHVKYFAQNGFSETGLPVMYQAFHDYIITKSTNFVVTTVEIWAAEKDFLAQYYELYTGELSTSTYHYRCCYQFYYGETDFVLLHAK